MIHYKYFRTLTALIIKVFINVFPGENPMVQSFQCRQAQSHPKKRWATAASSKPYKPFKFLVSFEISQEIAGDYWIYVNFPEAFRSGK